VNRLHTALTRARAGRAHRREERALRRAVAGAPTVESAHELTSLLTRR
jgi:hypothetical protein